MTQPEETTAALVARLHEENRIAYSELARLTHIGAQEAAERERLKRERDEQRARADKAERWLKHTSEREMKLDADLAKASERVQGLANELDQERLKSQALLKFKNIWLDRCTKARKERDEFRASHAALDRLLAERTRERDEARAESLQAGLVGREMAENLDAVTAECVKAQDLAQRHSQDCERALRERDEAREHLTKLEWAGLCKDDRGGPLTACCPICQGVKPGHEVGSRFAPEQVGHRPDCWFAKQRATIPAGTMAADSQVRISAEFKPEFARPEPRFKVGEKVVTESQPWTITKVVRFNCGPWWYEGDGDTRWQEAAVKPAPKFAVGEWVTWHNVDGEIAARRWSTDLSQWEYALGGTHITEAHLTAQTPQHKQCGAGYAFLGRMTNATDTDWDLWFAKDGSLFVPGPALASDAGNEFHLASAGDKQTRPELIEARRRAVARGLVK